MVFFEDIEVGQRTLYGHHAISREEMLEFAHKYDPQPFHISDEEAAKTHFGSLAASGLLTAAIAMGVTTRHFAATGFQGRGSPGLEELLWLHPVHAGDRLAVWGEVLEKRTSKSKPDLGLVRLRTIVANQQDDDVMRFCGVIFVQRRMPSD